MRKNFLNRSTALTMLFVLTLSVSRILGAPCGSTVFWHNASDTGCGPGQTNPGIINDVFDQNIDIIGTNALVDGIRVAALGCDIRITVSNSDSVITGSGNRCDGVPTDFSRLYLFADEDRTITFELTADLLFRGTSDGGDQRDLLVTFSGPGRIIFTIDDNVTVSFSSIPGSGGTKAFVLSTPDVSSTVEFRRFNTNSTNNVNIVIGPRSGISFIAPLVPQLRQPENGLGRIQFDPSDLLTGLMILNLQSCSFFDITSHALNADPGSEFLLSDIAMQTLQGAAIVDIIRTIGITGLAALQVINDNECYPCESLFSDPFCQDNINPAGFFGFILGPDGTLNVNNLTYLDYIGTTSNTCCVFTRLDDCGEEKTERRLRNPSAFIVDSSDDETPTIINFFGRSAIYFRSGIDKCGVVTPDFIINENQPFEQFKTPCAGNIVFDVEGYLNIIGHESAPLADDSFNGINILSLQVNPTGCPVLVDDGGPAVFPQRTFARSATGEYLRYNSGAMLVNNRTELFNTTLIHTDQNHNVWDRGNLGNPNLVSEPTYIGGDTFTLCADQVNPPFVRQQCRPFISFTNSEFRVHTNVASVGVDFSVPNNRFDNLNISNFIFYNNGLCIDKGYGRIWVLGTDPCFENCCFASLDPDSHLDVMQTTTLAGSHTLNLLVDLNTDCITEGITPADTGLAVQTLFLNNNSNISVGTLGLVGTDCFGNSFPLTTIATFNIVGSFFSFETKGGVLGYPQSSGSTGKGGIFVDTNGVFGVFNNAITNIGTMVTKSGNGVIVLPQRSVFFDPRVGIQNWALDLSIPANQIIITPTDDISDYSLDWGVITTSLCCTADPTPTCFRPYVVSNTPGDCQCPPVTAQNLTNLPTVQGTVQQFQILRSRIGDPVHLKVDGGFIRELVFLVGFNSAEAPVGVIVVQNEGTVGLGSAHKNVDSLEASIKLGVNGVQLVANGDGNVILNEDIIIDNVCHILSGTDFGVDGEQRLRLYSTTEKKLVIKNGGVLDLSQFDSPNKVLEFSGEVILVAEPGARIILNGGGRMVFSGQSRFELQEVLNLINIPTNTVSDSDDIRVRMSGVGQVVFTEDSSMFVPRDTFLGIETFEPCSLVTTISVIIQDQASVQIGSEEVPGGAVQIGDTTISSVERNIDFFLILDGQGALFQLDRQGFLGFEVGIIQKLGSIPNTWVVGCLHNVRKIGINVTEGTFLHDQIVTGDDSLASLLAIRDDSSMLMDFAFDNALVVIRAGGNINLLTFAEIEGTCVSLVPTVTVTSGEIVTPDGTLQPGIMAGNLLIIDPSKGVIPVAGIYSISNVSPQTFYNYIKTDDYTVMNFKRANAASNHLNILTIDFITGGSLINRVDLQQGKLLGLNGIPVGIENSVQLGAVAISFNNGDLGPVTELLGATIK